MHRGETEPGDRPTLVDGRTHAAPSSGVMVSRVPGVAEPHTPRELSAMRVRIRGKRASCWSMTAKAAWSSDTPKLLCEPSHFLLAHPCAVGDTDAASSMTRGERGIVWSSRKTSGPCLARRSAVPAPISRWHRCFSHGCWPAPLTPMTTMFRHPPQRAEDRRVRHERAASSSSLTES